MMTGLPYSTPESEIMTAERICGLSADGARIYPTMVFHGTELEKMTLDGRYIPPVPDDAVSRTAGVLGVFVSHGVPVIRIGFIPERRFTRRTASLSVRITPRWASLSRESFTTAPSAGSLRNIPA